MMMFVSWPDQADTQWWQPQMHAPVPGEVRVALHTQGWKQPMNARLNEMLAQRFGQGAAPQQQ